MEIEKSGEIGGCESCESRAKFRTPRERRRDYPKREYFHLLDDREAPDIPASLIVGDDDIVHITLEEVGVGSSILPLGIYFAAMV